MLYENRIAEIPRESYENIACERCPTAYLNFCGSRMLKGLCLGTMALASKVQALALASKVQALALRDEALALRFWP